MKNVNNLVVRTTLTPKLLSTVIGGLIILAGVFALQQSFSTDLDQDGVLAADDPDDNDPCVPYAVFCNLTADLSDQDSLIFGSSGGDITGYESLYLLTNGGGEILDARSFPRFAPQRPGLYRAYGLYFVSGEAPTNTSPGNTIDQVSFPNSCGQHSDSLLFKVEAAATFPVEWVDFSVRQAGEEVRLNWITTHERNCDSYQIERSLNGKSFQVLGSLPATGENSNQPNVYRYTDSLAPRGGLYYRIRQWDLDGRFSFSDVRLLQLENAPTFSVQLYPNPNQGQFSLRTQLPGHFLVHIVDLNGKIIWQQAMDLGVQPVVRGVDGIVPGVYLVRIEDTVSGLFYNQKMVVKP